MSDYSRTRRTTEEPESFFCRFTFGQFFALLVLEVFTLFFVFYLGARYGREFLGMNRGPEIAVVGKPAETSLSVRTTDDPEAREIARDLIAKAQTPELKERIAEMLKNDHPSRPEPAAVRPAPEAPLPVENIPQTGAGPSASPATASGGPLPMRSPTEAAADDDQTGMIRIKSAENARYSIQVGSYQSGSEAKVHVDHWKSRGYPAYVMLVDIPDRGRWYRVRIGGFATRDDATRYLARMREVEVVREALIVQNEQ